MKLFRTQDRLLLDRQPGLCKPNPGCLAPSVAMTKLYNTPRWLLLDAQPGPSAPPKNGDRVDHSFTREANFDTHMVIIIAALLCALIFALGLNSIVRCALRCSRRIAFESPDSAAARLAITGLKKSKIREIPVAVYGSGTSISATDCPICLGEFINGDKVRILPKCHHGFHMRCIDIWLASHSSCPTCRQCLLDQPPLMPEAGGVEDGV